MTPPDAAGFQVDDLNPELAVMHELLAAPDLDAAAREMIAASKNACPGPVECGPVHKTSDEGSSWLTYDQQVEVYPPKARPDEGQIGGPIASVSVAEHSANADFIALAFNHAAAVAREMLRRGERIAELEAALIRHELNDSVLESMGVYPASVNGVERSEKKTGWNEYGDKLLSRQIKVDEWFRAMPDDKRTKLSEMLLDDAIFIQCDDDERSPAFYFLTSDLFAWGYADWDEVTDELLNGLHEAWKASGSEGMLALYCKLQNQKPQWPIEKSWRLSGLWDAELEALPECKYDDAIGRWKNKSKAEAIAALESPP